MRLFPDAAGLPVLPGRRDRRCTTAEQAAALAGVVERELQPFGVDAVGTAERLAAFHRVENTYLSTFQALGGLGLLLGTVGLAAVMFRNVLERRRELALLRAVGYDTPRITLMILAEAIFLLLARSRGRCGLRADRRHSRVAHARRRRARFRPDPSARGDRRGGPDLGRGGDAGSRQRTAARRAASGVGRASEIGTRGLGVRGSGLGEEGWTQRQPLQIQAAGCL